jgi:adenosylcobinamide kinase/adenosylcobinamide-phosphate guanylyltransferase
MQQGCPREVTFVLGGARSGKSRFAQRNAFGSENVVFIATATACDPEMQQRIERHRLSRPTQWRTLEVPLDLDAAIWSLKDEWQLAIIDCLTVYLANVMSHAQSRLAEIQDYMERLCAALKNTRVPIVVVSNEVGCGIHPITATGRLYCDLLGGLNQRVASLADNVIAMTAGIPIPIKGQLPLDIQSGSGSLQQRI